VSSPSQSNSPTRKTVNGPLDPDVTTLHNAKKCAPSDKALCPRKLESSATLPCEPQILHFFYTYITA